MSRSRLTRIIAGCIIVAAFALPSIVVAQVQFNGLVPVCGTRTFDGAECELCYAIALANNLIDFVIIYISWPIAAVLFAYAGFTYMTSAGNPGGVSTAKAIFTNVAIGFIIILIAWLVIDAIMGSLVNQANIGRPWHQIECVGPTGPAPGSGPTGTTTVVPTPTPTPTASGNPSPSCQSGGCAALASGIDIKPGACSGASACQVNSELGMRLQVLDSQLSAVDWRVTEAWPPTTTHLAACHQTGHCVDANFTTTQPSAQNILTFINTAKSANLTGVYEVGTSAERDTLRASLVALGMSAADAQQHVISASITAPHFSVYCAESDRICRATVGN